MKRLFIFLLLIVFKVEYSAGQNQSLSKIYDPQGQLKADTSFIISQNQLNKWMLVEDLFTTQIFDRLYYPRFPYELGIKGKVIISFSLDTLGNFNDFRLEKSFGDSEFSNVVANNFSPACFAAIMFWSGNYVKNGFKANSVSERYFLPFEFETNTSNKIKVINNGWLKFDNIIYVPLKVKEE